ncbi:MAG: hypothetical protein A2Y17_01805 [Clostridiales bacterium GWF2_38_85]|nr:MAG: hypothetical protein A2Y17_01805 [Clostridiales bacterium GWF2_38_85]
MKKLRITAFLLALCMIFAGSVCAADISPSISVIRQHSTLTKCGISGSDISFTVSDFENTLGIKGLKYITITELPVIEQGVLKLGGIDIIENQTIPRSSIPFVKFVPKQSETAYAANFAFTSTASGWEDMDVKCVINVLPTINFSPIAGGCTFETVQGVAAIDTLAAYDPDSDTMVFEITSYPKNGTLTLVDATAGSFVYTPKDKYKGKDAFKYKVTDVYGNISKEATAEIQVDKNVAQLVYADMQGHWAHSAAIKLAGLGIACHEEIAGVYYFEPEKAMSRGNFAVMLLMAASYGDKLEPVSSTGFADDDLIPVSQKAYIALAKELGIVTPKLGEDGKAYLQPNAELTRAEAAVMISKLLNLESNASLATFSDSETIPAEAVKYIAALYEEGIMSGVDKTTMAPNEIFDRAQTAAVLVRVIEYLDEKDDSGGILSWFGLR